MLPGPPSIAVRWRRPCAAATLSSSSTISRPPSEPLRSRP